MPDIDITLRSEKGAMLTHEEVDENFSNLKAGVESYSDHIEDADVHLSEDERAALTASDSPAVDNALITQSALTASLAEYKRGGTTWIQPPEITINADDTKFDISSGVGVIFNYDYDNPSYTFVEYAGATGVTPSYLDSHQKTYLRVNTAGALVQDTALQTSQELRDFLYVGFIEHEDNVDISNIQNEASVGQDDTQTMRDLAAAVGVINKSGNTFGANGANMKLNKSAGVFFSLFGNILVSPDNPHNCTSGSLSQAEIFPGYYNGANWVYATASVTDVPIGYYNDITSGLVASTTGKFLLHRIYVVPGTDTVLLHYGQEEYDTLDDAIAGVNDTVETDEQLDGASLRCYLAVSTDATDLSNAAQASFVEASRFGSIRSGGAVAAASGEANVLGSVGGGVTLVYGKSSVTLQLKTITSSDSSLEFSEGATELDIALADTVPGTKTFANFPVTPSSAPTTDYQVANKKYADDEAAAVLGAIPDDATTLEMETGTETEKRLVSPADVAAAIAALAGSVNADEENNWTAQQIFGEMKFTPYSLTGTNVDPANGAIQYKTLTGNTTLTESLESGQAVLMLVDDGTAYTITHPTITWLTDEGVAPVLKTSGYTGWLYIKLLTTLYGIRVTDKG